MPSHDIARGGWAQRSCHDTARGDGAHRSYHEKARGHRRRQTGAPTVTLQAARGGLLPRSTYLEPVFANADIRSFPDDCNGFPGPADGTRVVGWAAEIVSLKAMLRVIQRTIFKFASAFGTRRAAARSPGVPLRLVQKASPAVGPRMCPLAAH